VQSPLGHCWTVLHAAALLLQVPGVRHCALVWQVLPFRLPAPVHLPLVGGHCVLSVQLPEAQTLLAHWLFAVQTVPLLAPPTQVLV
jgi:hypothetical protein